MATGLLMSKEILLPHRHQLSGAGQEHHQERDQAAAHHAVAWQRNIKILNIEMRNIKILNIRMRNIRILNIEMRN